jgi:hypothetical protein
MPKPKSACEYLPRSMQSPHGYYLTSPHGYHLTSPHGYHLYPLLKSRHALCTLSTLSRSDIEPWPPMYPEHPEHPEQIRYRTLSTLSRSDIEPWAPWSDQTSTLTSYPPFINHQHTEPFAQVVLYLRLRIHGAW